MGGDSPPVAAVDIGTNTARLLIADVAEGSLRTRERMSRVVRLGQGVDASGQLAAEAVDRTLDALAVYERMIDDAGCRTVRAVATSAVRDAANRDGFLDAAATVLGTRPDVITGAEEAALSFAGTTHVAEGDGPFLVIDPGGGSTEFVLGVLEPDYAVSVDIGSVRLTERAFPVAPPTPAQLAGARSSVDAMLADQVSLPDGPARVFGVGGTFTSLCGIFLARHPHDDASVHGTAMTVDDLHGLVDRLALMKVDQIADLPSLDPKRAPVLLGGAVVAERSLLFAGADEVVISECDILDGIALGLASV